MLDKYTIRDIEALTEDEAKQLIADYEKSDMEEETYTPDFYEYVTSE